MGRHHPPGLHRHVGSPRPVLLGLYFLGVFRTSHDTPADGIGWGRHIAAIVCITFAFYLIPGLFGAPLQSISGLIPPMDGSTLTLSQGSPQASSGDNAAAATGYSTLKYHTDLDEALAESEATGKPVFVVFKSHTCSVCKQMEATVLSSAAVMDRLSEHPLRPRRKLLRGGIPGVPEFLNNPLCYDNGPGEPQTPDPIGLPNWFRMQPLRILMS